MSELIDSNMTHDSLKSGGQNGHCEESKGNLTVLTSGVF